MSRIVEAEYDQQWMLPLSLEDLLPPDHPARFVRDLVDQLDLRSLGFKMPKSTSAGGPAYSTDMLLRVWVYGWLKRIRSPRRHCDALADGP
jgi:transposase